MRNGSQNKPEEMMEAIVPDPPCLSFLVIAHRISGKDCWIAPQFMYIISTYNICVSLVAELLVNIEICCGDCSRAICSE